METPTGSLVADPRLRLVEWRDLTQLSRLDVLRELSLSVPWLLASLWLAARGWYLAAAGCSFFFFLTGLRQVHDLLHHNLGLGRRATNAAMFMLSVLMLGAMHAVQYNHMQHHRDCLGPGDVEAISARMPWWKAVLWGPVFPVVLHLTALRRARPGKRRWIVAELIAIAGLLVAAGVVSQDALRFHVAAMAVGQCLTAFFAVWTVHHDCDPALEIGRSLRHPLKSAVAFDMFFHVEHHLFPRVPTRHLPALARRLDEAMPGRAIKQVY